MKKLSTFALALIALTTTTSLLATTASAGRIDRRERHQAKRIRNGVKSGELTKDERKSLRAQERSIHAEKKAARADGVVTKEERKEIRQDQNEASKDIYRMKHNDADTGGAANTAAPATTAE